MSSRKLPKRLRQLAYLGANYRAHRHCKSIVRSSRLAPDPLTPLKYLGDHLSLSLNASARRDALVSHYTFFPRILDKAFRAQLQGGILLWEKPGSGSTPPLRIFLEPASHAPMEGELQLRFAFRTDLLVLTFQLAPGHIFNARSNLVLFIGGVQGRMDSREELREASKLNAEMSPATMLILTVQALAKASGISEIIAVGQSDHISMKYARPYIRFDYERFWTEMSGSKSGAYYWVPTDTPQKALSEVPLTHRRRAKRRREAKRLVREALSLRFSRLISARLPAIAAEANGYIQSRIGVNRRVRQALQQEQPLWG